MRWFAIVVMMAAACGGASKPAPKAPDKEQGDPTAGDVRTPPKAEPGTMDMAGRCKDGDQEACKCNAVMQGAKTGEFDENAYKAACTYAIVGTPMMERREEAKKGIVCGRDCRSVAGIPRRVDRIGTLKLGMTADEVAQALELRGRLLMGKDAASGLASGAKLLGEDAYCRVIFEAGKLITATCNFSTATTAQVLAAVEREWGPGAKAGVMSEQFWRGTHGVIVLPSSILGGASLNLGVR